MASCDKNRLSPVQQKSRIPVRTVTRLNNNSEKSSSSKNEANKKQSIQSDRFMEKLQSKRPSRIPVVGQTNRKTGKDKFPKNVIPVNDKRPLGRDSGINLKEKQAKQAARTKTTASPPNAKCVAKITPSLRRREQVTSLNTKQVSSCEKIHKKELEQLVKENSEIIEELQLWVEDGDQENKTLEEIIEKSNEENVKLLVQISVMKKEMKDLQEKNDTLQNKLETKRADLNSLGCKVDALEKELAHFKTCELDYKKLEDRLASLTKENARITSEKIQEINQLKDENSGVINQLEEQLATSMKENAKIMFEKDKELNERLQEEKSRVFDQFKDRIASFMNENAKIISEKDKEMNELKKQKSKVIEQLESEKWSIIGQFNERLAEKDKELKKLQHEKWNIFDQFKDRLAMIMDENATFLTDKDKEINKLKEEKSKSICQLNNQLAQLKRENATMKTELSKVSNKNKRLAELHVQQQVKNLKEQKNLT
ncbi:hypothetical protein ACROYT_G024382 [Oculina patagonica]